jgi:hypothetical protein
MKQYLLLISLLVTSLFTLGQGLQLDSVKYKNVNTWQQPKILGYSTKTLPKSYSLKKYCPIVREQGNVASCVGWASAYAGLTIAQNAKMGVTDYHEKQLRAFDANFLYGLIKSESDNWCQEGTTLPAALTVLTYFGCKPEIWEPWFNCHENGKYNDFTMAIASFNKINDFYTIAIEKDLDAIKMAIFYELPVIIGVDLTESFEAGGTVNSGLWSPKVGEVKTGGHAICVTGYDDQKYGGAFEVMNSWGEEFGEGGFIWIKYSDFYTWVKEAYVLDVGAMSASDCSIGNCFDGYGRKKYPNGVVYEGYYEKSLPSIFGSFLFPDKSFYIGEVNGGKLHGEGVLYDMESAEYFDVTYRDNILVQSQTRGFAGENQSEQIKKIHQGITNAFPESKRIGDMTNKMRDRVIALENDNLLGK